MPKDDGKNSANSPHNLIDHEKPDREKQALYWHHKRAGTLGTYYELYPDERPVSREPVSRGRGGR